MDIISARNDPSQKLSAKITGEAPPPSEGKMSKPLEVLDLCSVNMLFMLFGPSNETGWYQLKRKNKKKEICFDNRNQKGDGNKSD